MSLAVWSLVVDSWASSFQICMHSSIFCVIEKNCNWSPQSVFFLCCFLSFLFLSVCLCFVWISPLWVSTEFMLPLFISWGLSLIDSEVILTFVLILCFCVYFVHLSFCIISFSFFSHSLFMVSGLPRVAVCDHTYTMNE